MFHAIFSSTKIGFALVPLKKFIRFDTSEILVADFSIVVYVVQGAERLPVHVPRVKFNPDKLNAQLPFPHGPFIVKLFGCHVNTSDRS